ncbi:hypothetical protein PUNSTDRAFT_136686 [Punctularia strigosozonata HHB-11173 SS5]|uniref:uncharacterized protein n=1 Tax=Punctularia strigosozonata (strain HHB-11173) TaxID=741275 RepID=UPI0004417CBE|nr:uncharacterized protein PUNSTDRAFT_136686 [Punctularia strigosozonata HHB-11173 SS5]EIN06858.1 hypothetical protein PUNSTDRAFT_136686 [Punctularia strigosozonata HHB-11173 SS5]
MEKPETCAQETNQSRDQYQPGRSALCPTRSTAPNTVLNNAATALNTLNTNSTTNATLDSTGLDIAGSTGLHSAANTLLHSATAAPGSTVPNTNSAANAALDSTGLDIAAASRSIAQVALCSTLQAAPGSTAWAAPGSTVLPTPGSTALPPPISTVLPPGMDVVALDAVQLTGSNHGQFSKVDVLQRSSNPLHFTSPVPTLPTTTPPWSNRSAALGDSDKVDLERLAFPSCMTIQISEQLPPGSKPSSTSSSTLCVLQHFHLPPPTRPTPPPPPHHPPPCRHRLRIIYICNFLTVAPSSPPWYLSHLAAVCTQCQGPVAHSTLPVSNPIILVFSMTPPPTSPPCPMEAQRWPAS